MEARSILAVVVLIVAAAVKLAEASARSGKTSSGAKKSAARTAPVQRAPFRPAQPVSDAPRRPMPPPDVPDAACVVCDNTGEDHFAHDKAQRIAQLDDFLKNGIIDKAEYRTLRSRYERGL